MKYNLINNFYNDYLSLFSTTIKTIVRNLKGKKFEPEVEALVKILSPGDVCLDIGGGYGRYALPLSKLVGLKGRVFSFEPGRYSYRVLRVIKWFHRLKNVSIYKVALSDKEGFINLCLPVKKTGKIGPSLAFISEEEKNNSICELVNTITVDDFCKENIIKRVNFIKCDTEGSEFLIFRGAKEILNQFHPAILCEIDSGNMSRYGYKPKDLEDFLRAFGYKIFSYKEGKFVINNKITENGNYFFMKD